MAEDDRDFIERAASAHEKLDGRAADMDKMVENFALCGLTKRAEMLESLDDELRGEINSSPQALRRRAQLMGLRRTMGSLHEALRKAKR
jgi:hypothetical protein